MTVLVYETQYELMYSLARFQEFYENPVLAGKVFSRQDVQNWQPDYYVKWNGCNFPARVPERFRLSSNAWDLDVHEEHALSEMPVGSYIVGVHLGSGEGMKKTLLHERAHALYAAEPQYMNKCRDLVMGMGYDQCQAWQYLETKGYGRDVIPDEIQAYTVCGWRDEMGPKHEPLQAYIRSWSKHLKLEDA